MRDERVPPQPPETGRVLGQTAAPSQGGLGEGGGGSGDGEMRHFQAFLEFP